MPLIVDFDNTISIRGCDVDDAFALFYLIGSKSKIDLVTTTHGNSNEDDVYEASLKMFKDLDIKIPLYKGGLHEDKGALAIKDFVNNNKGTTIISLGATTNTAKALDFGMKAENIEKIIFMGGIFEDLQFKNRIMDELNLSVDYRSTIKVLKAVKNNYIITGNACLPHKYTINKDTIFKSTYLNYIKSHLLSWLDDFEEAYDERQTVVWDAIAAVFLIHEEFFNVEKKSIALGENLKNGYLKNGKDKEIFFPWVKDGIKIMDHIIDVIEGSN